MTDREQILNMLQTLQTFNPYNKIECVDKGYIEIQNYSRGETIFFEFDDLGNLVSITS